MKSPILVGAVLSLSACGHMQAYEQELRAREAAEAARPTPAPRLSHAERTLHVRAYADQDYRAEHANYRADVAEMLEVAALIVGPQLDAAITLDGVRDFERECDPGDAEGCLDELARLDPGAPDVWVVALTGSLPTLSRDLDALGAATPLGRHLFLHGLSARDDGDDFDMTARELRAAERHALEVERHRHKGAVVFMHAFAHSLGALHGGDAATVTSREYAPEQAAFTPESTELLTRIIDAQLRGAADLEASYRTWLEQHPRAFVQAEYDARLAALAHVAAEKPEVTARLRELADDPALGALSDEDRAQLASAHARALEGQTDAALSAALELAQRYPDVAPVQLFACDLSRQQNAPAASASCARAERLGAH